MHVHGSVAAVTSLTTPPAPSTTSSTTWSPRVWALLITLCIVLFLDGLDVSMIGVALPSIGAELDLSTSSLQWLVSGYILGYGGLLLLGGRTADLFGRRKVFLIALALFAIASLAGGLVSSGPLLIATRFIKGLAAAFTAPTGLSIITTNFAEGPARNKALSIYTVFGAGGDSPRPLFCGPMTHVGWLRACLAIIAVAGSYFSWQFIVTLYLQDDLGWSPLELALAILPVGLMVTASAVFSHKLVN